MAADYQKQDAVVQDMIQKNCELGWTDRQIKEYVKTKYNYTEETAKTYIQRMWRKIKENVNMDYEDIVAGRIEQLAFLAQNAPDYFTKLQVYKELNKIQGLHINKVQVSGQINHITTIRITEVKPLDISPSDEIKQIDISNAEQIDIPMNQPNEMDLLTNGIEEENE